jgi:outer membrane protein TolC
MDEVRLKPSDLAVGLEHHPQITMLAGLEQAAQAEAETARASRLPDWTLGVSITQRGPGYPGMLNLSVSVPIPWDRANRQDREHFAKLAVAEQRRAEREEAARMHVLEAQSMLSEWKTSRERLKRYDETVLALAAERTQAATSAYRSATASLGSVLEARRSELDLRIERTRLDMETSRLWARLNYLIPMDHAGEDTPP